MNDNNLAIRTKLNSTAHYHQIQKVDNDGSRISQTLGGGEGGATAKVRGDSRLSG